jgi:UDP-2-acetamido-2,6-beta-L-arabino-hexul-4-ose reductase
MANPATRHRVGITGPRGFIGSHVVRHLSCVPEYEVVRCPRDAFKLPEALCNFVRGCDTVIHLAGLNSGSEQDIYDTNVGLVERLVEALTTSESAPHVVFASSIQRDRATAYGRSKKVGESRLREWAKQSDARLKILVIPNVFGPGCRPYYNSMVATFCEQLCHDQQPVLIDDQALTLVWINDLVEAIVQILDDDRPGIHEARMAGSAQISASELLAKLQSMCDGYFDTNTVPNLADPFDANLFTTFLSHVELDDHRHRPKLYADARGELYEIMRLAGGGQIFFSTTKPGAIRGNHFHSRKVEWFCVVRGEAVIRIRRVDGGRVREFRVSGAKPEFISIPALHMHQIENVGSEDLLTMFWCNEVYSPADPDTFHENVA